MEILIGIGGTIILGIAVFLIIVYRKEKEINKDL